MIDYALRNGKMIYVDSVMNGKDCQCECPLCHQKLIARNNSDKIKHHFSHFPKTKTYIDKNGNSYVRENGNKQYILFGDKNAE